MKGNHTTNRKRLYFVKISISFLTIMGTLVLSSCSVTNIPVRLEPTAQIVESNQDRDELFVNANIWLVESFKSAKDVIQFSDKEAGIVMGKYLLQAPSTDSDGINRNPEGIYALIKLQIKDGASRITIIPETFYEPKGDMYRVASYTRKDIQEKINVLVQSYIGFVKYDRSNEW